MHQSLTSNVYFGLCSYLFIRSQHLFDIVGTDQAGRLWLFSQVEEQHSNHARRGEQHSGNSR